jgi:cell envelope-related function transcriptional attenuator common domain
MSTQNPLPPRGETRRAKKREGRKPRRKWLLWLLLPLLLIAGGAAWYLGSLYDAAKDAIRNISTEDVEKGETASVETPRPTLSVREQPIAMLVMGLDSRPKLGTLNTDVLMAAALDPEEKRAVVVTIPRDTRIDVDGYQVWKANAYYANFYTAARKKMDSEQADLKARDELKELFGKFFGIPIDYTAKINFKGFSDVVDALGGIEVYVDQDMKYTDVAGDTYIDLRKGQQRLNGDQALGFVRYRQSNGGTRASSDLERNRRQSEVIGALTDRLMSLGGLTKLDDVIKAVGNNLSIDMPASEIERMIKVYFNIRRSNITFIQLDGEWRSPYIHLNEAKLEEAKAALRDIMAPRLQRQEAMGR